VLGAWLGLVLDIVVVCWLALALCSDEGSLLGRLVRNPVGVVDSIDDGPELSQNDGNVLGPLLGTVL
jgi:hypothetical protein